MVQEGNAPGDEEGGESVGTRDVKPRKPKRLTVTKVGKVGKGIVIERSGDRFIAPASALEYRGDDVVILDEDLEACLPYGAQWRDHLKLTVTEASIVETLHKRGIWTVEDFGQNIVAVRQAITSLIMPDLVRMYQKAAFKQAKEV